MKPLDELETQRQSQREQKKQRGPDGQGLPEEIHNGFLQNEGVKRSNGRIGSDQEIADAARRKAEQADYNKIEQAKG